MLWWVLYRVKNTSHQILPTTTLQPSLNETRIMTAS